MCMLRLVTSGVGKIYHVYSDSGTPDQGDLSSLERLPPVWIELARRQEIGESASVVSAYLPVRQKMVAMQQAMGRKQSLVMDGRDIGTVVLPDAPIKIFVTADLEVRAQRRYLDVSRTQPDIQFDDIMKDLAARDKRDQERAEAPLKPAHDAILLDTTSSSIDQSVDHVLDLVSRYQEQTN